MKNEIATLAGGCFWCTEALYRRLKGVVSVISGYAGGTSENPTYNQIHGGDTGHVESIQITFNPQVISYEKILDIFWHTHNPTTRDQQGYDHGPEYRSVIFYHSDTQKKTAQKSLTDFEKEGVYTDKIVTEILPFTNFYPAEDHHQNFYEKNKFNPYCTFIINPKLSKLIKEYSADVKEEYLQ